jgi:hypothetical protein
MHGTPSRQLVIHAVMNALRMSEPRADCYSDYLNLTATILRIKWDRQSRAKLGVGPKGWRYVGQEWAELEVGA